MTKFELKKYKNNTPENQKYHYFFLLCFPIRLLTVFIVRNTSYEENKTWIVPYSWKYYLIGRSNDQIWAEKVQK